MNKNGVKEYFYHVFLFGETYLFSFKAHAINQSQKITCHIRDFQKMGNMQKPTVFVYKNTNYDSSSLIIAEQSGDKDYADAVRDMIIKIAQSENLEQLQEWKTLPWFSEGIISCAVSPLDVILPVWNNCWKWPNDHNYRMSEEFHVDWVWGTNKILHFYR